MNNEQNQQIEQAEREVRNAQNQLDSALENLRKAKDNEWRHDTPSGCMWFWYNGTEGVVPAIHAYSNKYIVSYKHRTAHAEECHIKERGWKHAKAGEIRVAW